MARTINRLSALRVEKTSKPGLYGDGLGLYLQVSPTGSKSWLFRFMLNGKARKMGLGATHTVSLAEAREKASEARKKLLEGIDPIESRNADRRAKALEQTSALTFKEAAQKYVAAHRAGWKSTKHATQWAASLETYVHPTFGKLSVADVDVGLVLKVLEPIWTEKSETASRVRGRIENILDWATARGYRQGDNPARWRGHLDKLLPAKIKVRKVAHQPALPYVELPGFMQNLRKMDSISALALEFTILTVARTQAVIGAKLSEIDFDAKVWTVPASRQGTKLYVREHRVPLCDRATEIITTVPREAGNDHLFTGGKKGRGLSNAAMSEMLKNFNLPSDTPGRQPVVHGFRSTFRDWAAERTNYPREIAEAALAHSLKDKVEAAYQRGDLLAKRRRLMRDWANYCSKVIAPGDTVIGFRQVG